MHNKFITFVLPLLAVGSLAIGELGWISSNSPSFDSSDDKSFAGNFFLATNFASVGDGAFEGNGEF